MPSNQSREDVLPQQIAPRASALESCLWGQWVSYTWLIALSENTLDPLFSKDRTSPPSFCTMSKLSVKQVCRHLWIQTNLKSLGTLCEALVHTKQPKSALKRIGVVYQVPCADCNCVYIGETEITLKKTVSDHRGAVKRNESKNGMNAWKTQHKVDWEAARVRQDWWRWTTHTMEDHWSNSHQEAQKFTSNSWLWPLLNPIMSPSSLLILPPSTHTHQHKLCNSSNLVWQHVLHHKYFTHHPWTLSAIAFLSHVSLVFVVPVEIYLDRTSWTLSYWLSI